MEEDSVEESIPQTLRMLREISLSCIFKGVTLNEYVMLKTMLKLGQKSGNGRVYISEIVRNLHSSTPAVSKTLKIMESKNFVERETDPENRRKTFVYVTEEGCAAEADSDRAFHRFLDNVVQKIGKEDMDRFFELAERITAQIMEEMKLIQGGKESGG